MSPENVKELLIKYQHGTCTETEKQLVESWYMQFEDTGAAELTADERRADLAEIRSSLPGMKQPQRFWNFSRLMAAAVAILVVSAGLYFYRYSTVKKEGQTAGVSKSKIVPGGNKAILTLANGQKISLTDARNGQIAGQKGIRITKASNGQLVYTVTSNEQTLSSEYNTIETPKGGQYQVVLPDGSKVWLNAASSIRFPSSFPLAERRVYVTGEAYFEVTHNKARPFIVSVAGQEVEVLGTQFNVMAYADEADVRTTLVEGSVKLSKDKLSAVLTPGQQGFIARGQSAYSIANADINTVTAWKDGRFVFNGTNLYSLMRQLSRWYDVAVTYEDGVENDVFFGKISRSADLAKVLKILELGDLHFRMEGRTLIVMH